MTRVLGHVRRQDHAHDNLASVLLLLLGEVLKEVELVLEQDLDRFRCVPVLLHGDVVEAQRSIRHEVDVVRVIEAVVSVVMAGSSCDSRDHVEVVQLSDLVKVALFEKQIHHLSHISAMEVVVVLHIAPIPLANLIQETDQLVVVDHGRLSGLKGQIFHHTEHNGWERVLSSN